MSVPPPDGDVEEERDRTETRGPLPPPPQITDHQARAALLAHVADRCCWGSGAAKKMAIAKINYDSAFHVSTRNPFLFEKDFFNTLLLFFFQTPRVCLHVIKCAYPFHGLYLGYFFSIKNGSRLILRAESVIPSLLGRLASLHYVIGQFLRPFAFLLKADYCQGQK